MISHFFIDRPIFATVLSVVIVLTGGVALLYLPIAQYPQITPPSVQVSINYPGASAQVVADTVAAPIEQQVNGVAGMLYMSSQAGNDGSYTLSVTFDVGTDLNTALVMVQNRVSLATPLLPTQVQSQGISIRKKTPDILMIASLYSSDGRYDDLYLSNYATINIKDELLRVAGVSDVFLLGQRDYSIRAWLNPQKLASLNMNAVDVANAVRSQNIEAASGHIGQPPMDSGQPFDFPIHTQGRLATPEQFGNIILKVGPHLVRAPSSASASFGGFGLPASGVADPLQEAGASSSSADSGNGSPSTAPPAPNMPNPLTVSPNAGPGGTTDPTSILPAPTKGTGSSPQPGTTFPPTTGTSSMNAGTSSGNSNAPLNVPGEPSATLANGGASMSARGATAAGALSMEPPPVNTPIVRLRDVARVEIGAQNYNQTATFDGRPSVGVAVFLLPGTNALDVADRVKSKLQQLKEHFPEGVDYQVAYDITPFIRESIADVVQTLFEAVVLVGLVVFVFLQSWRTVLIPMLAVPVAIIGTFAVMAALGFSLNNISLFGLVLAIGIVVDDAIVVIENVERWLDHGLSPRDAARKAMDEVTGPVVAVALVLCAVFVPCAFISGITGLFFRQFAVTIAISTVFSAINSLTLSPALAAILLKHREEGAALKTRRGGSVLSSLLHFPAAFLQLFFRLFNRTFNAIMSGYGWLVGWLLKASFLVLLIYAGLLVLTYVVFQRAPTGFVPDQDQGRIIVSVLLPDAASLQRSREVLTVVEKIAKDMPGVAHTLTIAGMSFAESVKGSNFGSMFVILDPFEDRRSPDLADTAIIAKLSAAWAREVKDARVLAFRSPPIPGLSVAGGFKLMVEDRGGLGLDNLEQQTVRLVGKLQKEQGLVAVSTQFRSNAPQLFMDIDRTKVASLGVSFNDLNQTLLVYLGSLYVNSFNEYGRYWQVTLQAEGIDRRRVEDINLLKVRGNQGQMVPLGTLVKVRDIGGPIYVNRYNLYTAAPITGGLAPGVSSGDVIADVNALAEQTLPRSMNTEWTELMFIQIRAGNTAIYVFALAVLCVFLALAALYESWSLPLAVILVVPLCLLCSVAGVLFAHTAVNIFVQIGLVVLVGLACKNAILIVEFARHLHEQGKPVFEATEEASRLRLRPILMTSFAFILGVVPLVVATGAGAEMRRSLGTAVFSGMLGVTLFGIFLTPVFFYVIQGLGEMRWFKSPLVRQLASALLGGLLGAACGFLFTKLGHGRLPWGPALGAGAGVLTTLVLHEVARRRRRHS